MCITMIVYDRTNQFYTGKKTSLCLLFMNLMIKYQGQLKRLNRQHGGKIKGEKSNNKL